MLCKNMGVPSCTQHTLNAVQGGVLVTHAWSSVSIREGDAEYVRSLRQG